MAQTDGDKHKEMIKNPLGGECTTCGCNLDLKCGHVALNPNVGCGKGFGDQCFCCNRVVGVKKAKRTGMVM